MKSRASTRSSPVVEILDDPHPIGALRRFLDSIKGHATEQQAQIALGSAQLMLLPIAREARGGAEVKELHEREGILELRWWSLGSTETTDELLYPADLADKLRRHLPSGAVTRSASSIR